MNRRSVLHQLKRAASEHGDTDAMTALLGRSVRLGHKNLALIRCLQAEQMGIVVQPQWLAYCEGIAALLPVDELIKIAARARLACQR